MCEWLVPYRNGTGEVGAWSAAMLRKLKGRLKRSSGVRFHLKTFRATFAQMAIDVGVPTDAVSRGMRHASTKTTEKFYARIRSDHAFREFERVFAMPKVAVGPDGRETGFGG